MLNIAVRLLLAIAAFITSFFVARDALNFEIVQMVVEIILFTIIICVIAFWPMIKNIIFKKKNSHKFEIPGQSYKIGQHSMTDSVEKCAACKKDKHGV